MGPPRADQDHPLLLPDRIPTGTLRHLAHFLAPEASDPAATHPSALLALLRASSDTRRRPPTSRTPEATAETIPSGTQRVKPLTVASTSVSSPLPSPHSTPRGPTLTGLPTELLGALQPYLSPSDLVCLAQTCRRLSHALDYRLSDLGALATAWEPAVLVHDRGVRAAVARQRYDATARLDRDRLVALEQEEMKEERGEGVVGDEGDRRGTACGVCVRRHPRHFFAASQVGKAEVRERRCRAAEARVRVCEHWTEDLVSLRARRRRVRCGGRTRTWWEECEHASHRPETGRGGWNGGDGDFGAPCMLEFGGVFVVERTMVLIRTKQPRSGVGCDMVLDALRSRAHVSICPHVKLDDESIVTAFARVTDARKCNVRASDKETACELPEYEIMGCRECGCHWSFEIKTFEGKTTVRLNVDLQLPVLKDPWDQDYLKNAEDGCGLLELVQRK